MHEATGFLPRAVVDRALGRQRYKDFVKERVALAVVFEQSLELPFGFAALTFGSPVTVAICETSRMAAACVNDSAAACVGSHKEEVVS